MLNKCRFIGNLGKDPEIRSLQSGDKVCNLSLGCTKKWKNKDGEKQERTEWVRIVIFNQGLINVCENYLKKGAKIYIEGAMETRKWTDKDGQDRYSTEIVLRPFSGELVMLGKKGDGGSDAEPYDDSYDVTPQPAPGKFATENYEDDGEIPF